MKMIKKLFEDLFGQTPDLSDDMLAKIEAVIDETADKLVGDYMDSLFPEITFEKLSEDAQIPTYADEFAEGMDLYSPVSVTIPARGKVNIKLGIKANIPNTHWLMFASRSGLAWNDSVEKGAGIIDVNYRKELGLVLYNHGDKPLIIVKGDRVAQAIPMRRNRLRIKEGLVGDGERGGMGSTGR